MTTHLSQLSLLKLVETVEQSEAIDIDMASCSRPTNERDIQTQQTGYSFFWPQIKNDKMIK
jgi:hypothetical protein